MAVTVKTVSVTYDRKHNLGDYSSANIGCTIWADVTDDADLDEAMHALWDMAKANVKARLLPLTSKTKATVEQVFMGLPLELQTAVAAVDSDDLDDDHIFSEGGDRD
jgi:hypothetical protein